MKRGKLRKFQESLELLLYSQHTQERTLHCSPQKDTAQRSDDPAEINPDSECLVDSDGPGQASLA